MACVVVPSLSSRAKALFVILGEDLFVIPGEDPGSSVEHRLFPRPVVDSGSRLKAGMTKKQDRDDKKQGWDDKGKLKLQRAESPMRLCDIQADQADMPENRVLWRARCAG